MHGLIEKIYQGKIVDILGNRTGTIKLIHFHVTAIPAIFN